MDGRPTWTDCDEAGDYDVPNVLSPRDLVSRPDIMDETVPHTHPRSQNPWKLTMCVVYMHTCTLAISRSSFESSFECYHCL